jgi:hypothetical protein
MPEFGGGLLCNYCRSEHPSSARAVTYLGDKIRNDWVSHGLHGLHRLKIRVIRG